MNRPASLQPLLAAAALLLGTLAATAVHAQSDVRFSVTLGTPGIYVQSAPVYTYPRQVYVQPAPIYTYANPVYDRPAPVYVYPRPVYVQPASVNGWGHQRHHRHDRHDRHDRHVIAQSSWGDYDRDGTPNRYDRYPGNPNRR